MVDHEEWRKPGAGCEAGNTDDAIDSAFEFTQPCLIIIWRESSTMLLIDLVPNLRLQNAILAPVFLICTGYHCLNIMNTDPTVAFVGPS